MNGRQFAALAVLFFAAGAAINLAVSWIVFHKLGLIMPTYHVWRP
jgi:hypothetical protein